MGRVLQRRSVIVAMDMRGPRRGGANERPSTRHAIKVKDANGQPIFAPVMRPETGRGLGDLVEKAAKPIARWIDARHSRWAWLGRLVQAAVGRGWVTLPLAGCSECSRRRRLLNALMPDLRSLAAWLELARRVWLAVSGPL